MITVKEFNSLKSGDLVERVIEIKSWALPKKYTNHFVLLQKKGIFWDAMVFTDPNSFYGVNCFPIVSLHLLSKVETTNYSLAWPLHHS